MLQSYVGQYALHPGLVVDVTLEDGRLFAEATGQPRFEMVPTSNTRFTLPDVGAQVTFTPGPDGRAASLTLHGGGEDMVGRRVE